MYIINYIMSDKMHNLGQYFTTCDILLEKMQEFIKNIPQVILEPSLGRGNMIDFLQKDIKYKNVQFDCFEIDPELELLETINQDNLTLHYTDFIEYDISKTYDTIIGNPPYVKQKNGNLYLKFIEKCVDLLNDDGELIFIVPSDFFKLTSSQDIINKMTIYGTFTHVFLPYNEKLFEKASIDVMLFRYCKNAQLDMSIIVNDETKYLSNTNGMITYYDNKEEHKNFELLSSHFDVFVGMVTGKEEVFKNEELGNITMRNGEYKVDKYILMDKYPCENVELNDYMLQNKECLITRKIKRFTEKNWFTWGALRNKKVMDEKKGQKCIYVHNMTRNKQVAFEGVVEYFGGNLLMMIPKNPEIDLEQVIQYLNTDSFQYNFIYSGRFKIGHQQLRNVQLCTDILYN